MQLLGCPILVLMLPPSVGGRKMPPPDGCALCAACHANGLVCCSPVKPEAQC